ncbi:MAG: hypothetical protein GKS06_20255 [Acidobacteria bacterium]|nr:hypothetical protein [Acidobacteriota bacterium]
MATERFRIVCDLSRGDYERYQRLQETVGAPKLADVVREALQVYEYLAEEVFLEDASFRRVDAAGNVSPHPVPFFNVGVVSARRAAALRTAPPHAKDQPSNGGAGPSADSTTAQKTALEPV